MAEIGGSSTDDLERVPQNGGQKKQKTQTYEPIKMQVFQSHNVCVR